MFQFLYTARLTEVKKNSDKTYLHKHDVKTFYDQNSLGNN